jgi:16S rRNA (adenine1518-N6/adenine1519-N6)-dimethyltransferase
MSQVRPKKALGQHFLTDMTVAQRIADTISDIGTMPALEIGPGMGVLTGLLLEAGRDLRVVEGDFLKMDLAEIYPGDEPFAIIGNYPYNISSQIFFKVLDYKDRVTVCSGMLQREVAERLAAGPGTKARGILSVLLQAWYDVEYLFTVSEKVFNPPPKVKSGVIRMTRNNVTDLGCDEALFKTVVKTTFGQRRKTLRNSLRGLLPAGVALPEGTEALTALRPEQLTVAQFIELTNTVSNLRSQAQ